MLEATIVTAPRRILAAARERTALGAIGRTIGPLLDRVWAFLKANPDLRTDGHNIALYWVEGGAISVEVGVEVIREFDATPDVVLSATPAGRAATTEHWGSYTKLVDTHAALRDWCKAHGHALAGPSWEVYGDWSDDPAKLRTDVFYLLR